MSRVSRRGWVLVAVIALTFALPAAASANHSWGGYHWARTANPFTLQLGDNVSSSWDDNLAVASADWSTSSVLDTTVVTGGTQPKPCRPTSGRDEVCSASYGNNGWLGLAQIWISGKHITQGIVKLNDYYMGKAPYNTEPWHQLVVCQEIGHTFGLDHQDENFNNANLGTCMDYTSDPDGPPSNEHPNQHDYDQLVTIYSHLDGFSTVKNAPKSASGGAGAAASTWGRIVASSNGGRTQTFVLDLGRGQAVVTFVIWA